MILVLELPIKKKHLAERKQKGRKVLGQDKTVSDEKRKLTKKKKNGFGSQDKRDMTKGRRRK